MTACDTPSEPSDSSVALVIKCMCCIIAADGRVSGSEIDVVFDALASIGHKQSPEAFRDLVIDTCKLIHRQGVVACADSLSKQLVRLREQPLAHLMLQLQDDVIKSDNCVTHLEKAIGERFRDALCPASGVPGLVSSAGDTKFPVALTPTSSDGTEIAVNLTVFERLFASIAYVRHLVDANLGSRALIVLCLSVVCGAIGVLASGRIEAAAPGAVFGCALTSLLLYVIPDATVRRWAVDRPRARAHEAMLGTQAASITAALQVPPAVSTEQVVVPSIDDAEDGSNDGERDDIGFDTALSLVGHGSWTIPYRAKLARRIFALLRGSRNRAPGKTACRCTNCGRRYWFPVFDMNGRGVICPYCGQYQRATLDWKPAVPPPIVPVPVTRSWSWPSSTPSYSYGPVHVRGYVNKRGTWVAGHTRARPRRRR